MNAPAFQRCVDDDGYVTQEPWPALFTTTALDHEGTVIGGEAGDSTAEALLRLQRTPARAPYDGLAAYDDEPSL